MENHRTSHAGKVSPPSYVGRVGALAVALGIGAAVATMPGIARADDPAPSDVAKIEDADHVDETPNGPDAEVDDDTDIDIDADTENDTDADADADADIDTVDADIDAEDVDVDADVQESADATVDPSVPIAEPVVVIPTPTIVESPTAEPETTAAPTAGGDTSDAHDATGPSVDRGSLPFVAPSDAVASRTIENQEVEEPADGPASIVLFSNTLPDNAVSALVDADLPVPTVEPPSFLETLLAIPGTIIAAVFDLVTVVLQPLIGPGGPADNPVLWGLLAAARREFAQPFANQTPTLAPQQTSQDAGLVHGTFGGEDVDGDTLTYTVPSTGLGAPAYGTVEIDQAGGTWTYTPSMGFVGADFFFVTVSDGEEGSHVHAAGQTHTAAARVDVIVANTTDAPPVISDISGSSLPDSEGLVTGSFIVTDEDLDNVDVVVRSDRQPTAGTVELDFDRVTGLVTYAYRPTMAARLLGGAGETFAPDTFTVAVSDQVNSPVEVVVSDVTVGGAAQLTPMPGGVPAGFGGEEMALTPDGTRIYVVDYEARTISVIDVDPASATYNTVIGDPILLGNESGDWYPDEISITPDGTRAYVTIEGQDELGTSYTVVKVIDTDPTSATYHAVVGQPINAGLYADRIVFTPDGRRGYVINYGTDDLDGYTTELSVIDTDPNSATYNTVIGQPVPVGGGFELRITDDGTRAYVLGYVDPNATEGPYGTQILVVDTDSTSATYNTVIGSPIQISDESYNVLLGSTTAYVTDYDDNTVTVIDIDPGSATYNTALGAPIPVAPNPFELLLSSDGTVLYVLSYAEGVNAITVIDTSTNTAIGDPISIGSEGYRFAATDDGRVYVSGYSGSAFGIHVLTLVAPGSEAFTPV